MEIFKKWSILKNLQKKKYSQTTLKSAKKQASLYFFIKSKNYEKKNKK